MFERILALFKKSSGPVVPLPLLDARRTLGALMVRTARSDKSYKLAEVHTIESIFISAFGLSEDQAPEMRKICEDLEKQLPRTADLAVILQAAISEEQRMQAVWALWTVALADGIKHEAEVAVLDEVEKVFGISAENSQLLREYLPKIDEPE